MSEDEKLPDWAGAIYVGFIMTVFVFIGVGVLYFVGRAVVEIIIPNLIASFPDVVREIQSWRWDWIGGFLFIWSAFSAGVYWFVKSK